MFKRAILLALLAAFGFQIAASCSCAYVHEQEAYCAPNNALDFYVQRRTYAYIGGRGRWRYQISNLKVYQTKADAKDVDLKYIYSSYQSASCGVTLQRRQTYAVIGGSVYTYGGKKYFFVSLCDHIVNLNSGYTTWTRDFARMLLQWIYPATCGNCKICNSNHGNCPPEGLAEYCDQADVAGTQRKLANYCYPIDYQCRWFDDVGLIE